MRIPNSSKSLQNLKYVIIFIVIFVNCELNLFAQNQQNENIQTPTTFLIDDVKEKETGKNTLDENDPLVRIGLGFDCMYNILKMSDNATKFNDYATGMGNSVYLILQLNSLKSISKNLTLSVGIGLASLRPNYKVTSKDLFANPTYRYIYDCDSYMIKPSLDYDIDYLIASIGITSNIVTESNFIVSKEITYINDLYIVKDSKMGKFASPIFTFNIGLSKKFNVTSNIDYFPYIAYDLPLSNFGDTKIFGNNNALSNYRVGMYILMNM